MKRYNPSYGECASGTYDDNALMFIEEDGEYVKFADAEKLIQEALEFNIDRPFSSSSSKMLLRYLTSYSESWRM